MVLLSIDFHSLGDLIWYHGFKYHLCADIPIFISLA